MMSDSYKMQEVDGMFYEVNVRKIKPGRETFGTFVNFLDPAIPNSW